MPLKGFTQLIKLPSHSETLLLRASLLSGTEGRSAWLEWRENTPDPIESIRRDNSALRRILPLLFLATQNHRIAIDGLFGTILRTAYFREHLRMQSYSQILEHVLGAFTAERIDAVILNGAALAHCVYADPLTRHCHDIDILTTENGIARAQRVLPSIGFSLVAQDAQRARFEHSSNVPIELYTRLRYQQKAASPFATVFTGGRDQLMGSHNVRVLAPSDALLQIFSHPVAKDQTLPLGVFCDAAFVIQRASGLVWENLVDRARKFGLAEYAAPLFGFMRDGLYAPIPDWVLRDSSNPRSEVERIPS